jgi:hypothetical protein
MPETNVPEIELGADGQAELTIRIRGYKPGKYIDIYGYVTQLHGAYVPFRYTGEIPKEDDDGVTLNTYDRGVDLKMPVFLGKSELKKEEPITVITWISEVWPSMLDFNQDSGNGKTVWKLNKKAEKAVDDSMEGLPKLTRGGPRWVDVPATRPVDDKPAEDPAAAVMDQSS